MHEMSLASNVVEIVLEEANAANAIEVRRVALTVGNLRDIVDDMFEGLFAYLTKDTIAEHATLEMTKIPVTVQCKRCGRVYPLNVRDRSTFPCPVCSETDYKLNSGMEFFINEIDIVGSQGSSSHG